MCWCRETLMREPTSTRSGGTLPAATRPPWYVRYRWLLIGGIVVDVGLVVVLLVLARRVLLGSAATVVVTVTTIVPGATTVARPTAAATPTPASSSQQIDAYIQRMTLTQKIGQLLL